MTKSLLLKGLAGVAAVGGVATGGIVASNKGWFGGKAVVPEEPKSGNVSDLTDKDLIDKAGLDCKLGEEEKEITGDTSKDCTVKEGSTLRIMVGTQEEDGVSFTTSESAKLKVSRSEEVGGDGTTELYNKQLKFVVDSGDLTLSKKEGGGTGTNIQKLEQFETYEIFLKEENKEFYLRRRTDAKEEKIKALGLPSSCTLLESGDSNCSLTTQEGIKKIKFEKQSDGITVNSGTVNLKITKMGVSDTDFGNDKYRFTFTFPSDVTIGSKTLKAKIPYEFKIKKGTGNSLTLEEAWSEDKEFAKKAGLKCEGNNNECTVPADSGSNLNVKVGNQKKEGITSLTGGTGKIKMEKEQEGYRQGLKFTISGADVSLTGGTDSGSGESISKLEELETYEITEEGGKYYLTRKTTKEEGIKSSLVLPQGCELPTSESPVECTLKQDAFKALNFESKGTSEISSTGDVSLTISKTSNTTDFPLGYKFTFNTTSDATIKSDTKIKANIPTDFKIKKNTSTPTTLTLEKAWSDTDYSFAKKVGLTCTAGTNECCSQTSGVNINVKRGNDKKEGITGINGGSGKIKVEKEQAGYNQGLKFTITTADVSLTGGNGGSFDKLEELETYKITEEGGKYYLTRKDEASKTIESQLGLPSSCKLSTNGSCTLTVQDLQKINFNEKDTSGASMTSGNATLTITKTSSTTEFPLGYKFTLQSTSGDITIKSNTNVVKNKIPTDFKIKKEDGKPVSLERAWNNFSFAEKAGLTCSNSDGTDTCCSKSSGQLNVKKGDDKREGITSINGSNKGKIKVEKDQEGYNQGLKFTIDGGDVSITGGTESKTSGSNEDLTKLEEYETYEIKESGGKYYLARKHESIVFIKKQLGLDFCTDNTWMRTASNNSGSSISYNCDINSVENLKKIKFHSKGDNFSWPSGKIELQLSITKNKTNSASSDDLEVEINDTSSGSSSVCIPDGNGGKAEIKGSTSGGSSAKYKINKGTGANTSWCLEKSDSSSSGQCSVS